MGWISVWHSWFALVAYDANLDSSSSIQLLVWLTALFLASNFPSSCKAVIAAYQLGLKYRYSQTWHLLKTASLSHSADSVQRFCEMRLLMSDSTSHDQDWVRAIALSVLTMFAYFSIDDFQTDHRK